VSAKHVVKRNAHITFVLRAVQNNKHKDIKAEWARFVPFCFFNALS